MNTTMAPLDKIPHGSLEDLEQRDSLAVRSLRRRKGDGNDNDDSDSKGRRKDTSDGNGDGKGSGNGNGGGGGGGGGKDDDNDDDGPEKASKPGKKKSAAAEAPLPTGLPGLPPPPPPPPGGPPGLLPGPPSTPLETNAAAASSTNIPVPKPAAASSSTPTAAIVITTTPLSTPSLPSAAPTTNSLSLLSPSATFISSLFPTTVAPSAVPTLATQISESLSTPQQPRKGEDSSDNGTRTRRPFTFTKRPGSTVTEMQTVMVTAQSAIAAPTPLPDSDPPKPDKNNDGIPNNNRFKGNKGNRNKGDLSPTAERLLIAAGAIGAFIIIMTIVYLVLIRKRIDPWSKVRSRKIRKGGNRGLYGWRRESNASEAPPSYQGDEYGYPVEKKDPRYDPSYPPIIKPVTLPPLAIPDFPATTVNTVTRGDSPNQAHAAALFGGYSPHESPISDPPASYNNTGRQDTFPKRQPSDANTSYGLTQSSMFTQQTTNLQPTNQELNHMSYMSSLSSGFGDGLIIPDPSNPDAPMQGYRQSRAPGTFSWMQPTGQQKGDRDTVYTTTSEAPRFRTVNSWVAHQAGRVDGTKTAEPNVPKVPAIPQTHQRSISEDPVFKYHPGDEVQISRGSRVPSVILDRKIGIDK